MASTALSALEPCRECHGAHTTSYGKQRCVLRKHRIEMRIMDSLLNRNSLTDELQDDFVEETGNTGYWLGHVSCFDELVEDTEKLEMQERLAEKGDMMRFIRAIQSCTTLKKVNVEMEELRAENAELRRKVVAFEDIMGDRALFHSSTLDPQALRRRVAAFEAIMGDGGMGSMGSEG